MDKFYRDLIEAQRTNNLLKTSIMKSTGLNSENIDSSSISSLNSDRRVIIRMNGNDDNNLYGRFDYYDSLEAKGYGPSPSLKKPSDSSISQETIFNSNTKLSFLAGLTIWQLTAIFILFMMVIGEFI
jgi:hypothetical protein